MARFGLVARGLWAVDFDTGDGYLSWRYPELRLAFFVDSEDSNLTRRSLSEVLAERLPNLGLSHGDLYSRKSRSPVLGDDRIK